MSENGIDQVTDFDAFWAEYSATAPKEKVKFLGELIVLPFDLPLELTERMQAADASDKKTLANLLQKIYGEDVLDKWLAKDMGVRQMAVLIAWTLARVQGFNMSLAEVAQGMSKAVSSGKLKALLEDIGEQ